MSKFATFPKGGIHPDDSKFYSADSAIRKLPLSEFLSVPMSQHLGRPAICLKAVGDRVEMGEKIGEANGPISANVHSPVSGVVTAIGKLALPNSVLSDVVVIQPDEVQPEMFKERIDWQNKSKDELISNVREMGIVGQGGATFPASVKLTVPETNPIKALIINCVECEPYLTADYRLVLEKTDEFLEGVSICNIIVNPEKVMIAFEANKKKLAEDLEKVIAQKNLPFEVKILKMKYPQGDEKQLIKACINREIPSGKLPSDVGAVVVNAGSAWAIFNAVVFNKPIIERVVTVTGPCIVEPSNFLVTIGTPVKDLIAAAGGFKEEPDKIISGGPMMGFAFYNQDTPITKGCGGILCIKDEIKHRQTACLSCGKCVAACPIGLEPTLMYRLITNGKYEDAMKLCLMDCKECGCCTYSCPAQLPLVQTFRLGKKMGRKK